MARLLTRRLPQAALVLALCLLLAGRAHAVSCTPQAQMTPGDGGALAAASLRVAGLVAGGDLAGLKSASVWAQFEGISGTAAGLEAALKGARFQVAALYALNAADLKPGEDEAQFFCSAPGSPLLVTMTISSLPAGSYALALVHAEGGTTPEHLALVLAKNAAGEWQLAGLFARPAALAGHDGDWYWSRARELNKAGAKWSAYFYYQTARPLLVPVDFMSSPNLQKRDGEATTARPEGLPGESGTPPMTVAAGDQTFAVTGVRTDASLGGLDLLVHYNANAANVDPVYQRTQAVALMRALLDQHPELRANFHGLWVYADSPGRQPYAVEMTMDQIAPAAH